MKVKLISYTPNALELLLGTKNTRLAHNEDVASWSPEKQSEHLSYMRDTIKSSWEFVDYVFEITEVTRAFTHQLVRTRQGAYAQESQRTIDASENGFLNPFAGAIVDGKFDEAQPDEALRYEVFAGAGFRAFEAYKALLADGAPAQDARGILPTATLTSIKVKFDLRTLHEMAKVRLCVRTQGEYQEVFRAMRRLVIEKHRWVAEHRFIEVHCVSEGTCAFPRYGKTQCPIYHPTMDLSVVKQATHAVFWSTPIHVARPVAKDGKTM